jgi:hypothetical protein
MARQQTKPSTPRLSDLAKHVVAPKDAVTTGWPSVSDKCAELGIAFKVWQQLLGKIILSKRVDGKYAATIGGTGMSIPRQVGKTYLVGGIVFALCLLFPKLTVIWTAHRLRTAEETFTKMQAFTKRRKIKPHILKVVLGSGDEEIQFHNGSRILFGARERGFGRGFDEVDVLIFDEAQILTDNALDDMIPATNQSRQPSGALLLFMGTPPKPTDPGEVFTRMRTESLSGEDGDTGWIEFGADSGFKPTPSPEPLTAVDWAQIAKANPSYPHLTPREAILRMRKNLGPESFLREGLGLWDESEKAAQVIAAGDWTKLAIPDDEAPKTNPTRYALAMSPERIASIAIAIPGEHAAFLDLAEMSRVDDSRKVIDWLVQRCGRRIVVMIDSRDPAAAFIGELKARGVKVNVTTQSDAAKACMGLLTAVDEHRIWHVDQPAIRTALRVARKKPIGKARLGLWEWDLNDPTAELAALRALTLAHFGLSFDKKRTGNGRSVSSRRAVSL